MAWKRYVRVVVRKKSDPTKPIIFTKNRIDFEVRTSVGWADSTATITIFNLSVDEMKLLQPKEFGEIEIELHAGYGPGIDGVTVGVDYGVNDQHTNDGSYTSPAYTNKNLSMHDSLFSGVVTNSVGYKRSPEHILTMFCASHVLLGASSYFNLRPLTKGMKLRDAIVQMCGDGGYSRIFYFGVTSEQLDKVIPSAYAFSDTFLQELGTFLESHNLKYFMASNEVQIFPNTYGNQSAMQRMLKDRAPLVLDKNSVIGNPIAGIGTFDVNTFITADVQPGMVLDTSKLVGENLLIDGAVNVQSNKPFILNTDSNILQWAMTDKYQIMSVVHHGSTHTENFMSSLSCILGGATEMGGDENSWRDLYIDSGRPGNH